MAGAGGAELLAACVGPVAEACAAVGGGTGGLSSLPQAVAAKARVANRAEVFRRLGFCRFMACSLTLFKKFRISAASGVDLQIWQLTPQYLRR
jgi:hypothetical protein